MNFSQYASLVHAGTVGQVRMALSKLVGIKIHISTPRQKIKARAATPPPPRANKEPKFVFNDKFFTKLQLMPSVDLEVVDSRSKIRKECYGFREKVTRERVYLKIDDDSVVMFRDSPAGFITGKRYLIPRLNLMYLPKTWPKVKRLMTRVLNEQGIIVTLGLVREYTKSNFYRYRLANILVARRIYAMITCEGPTRKYYRKGCLSEKAR